MDLPLGAVLVISMLLLGLVLVVWRRSRQDDRSEAGEAPPDTIDCDDDLRWLHPPTDVRDPLAWDHYWDGQLAHGNIASAFSDMMASDPELPTLLKRRAVRTVLCVGAGLSAEPQVLAGLGFEVTALDISARATEVGRSLEFRPNLRMHQARPGAGTGAGQPEPAAARGARPTLTYVTGDLMDEAVCPGPFDCIIERLTVQLQPSRELALERLAARLATTGLLVSHMHDGGWRPGDPDQHFAEDWARRRGFSSDWTAERAVVLRRTTG